MRRPRLTGPEAGLLMERSALQMLTRKPSAKHHDADPCIDGFRHLDQLAALCTMERRMDGEHSVPRPERSLRTGEGTLLKHLARTRQSMINFHKDISITGGLLLLGLTGPGKYSVDRG